ncbi:hypothetical protein PtA15_6A609 [Puccinia triticina]|uniref:Uncharacterized protein n=1 Tax=Puccinia triticina TaxID=208348 RepID=A0ABY7CL72_9BASI|nr:uncharacterized protein PtA15_6A609 [Puccinia triticina]WAQ85979.1 hypothetical protein PtA15_6A609 [Puccinia triticina]WAR55878.1 hypothetical protein PtB15_6B622 [Puccinia triticina]
MKSFLNKAIRTVIQSFDGQLNSLSTDESTIEYIVDLLSDPEIAKEEKQETIQGILELHLDPSSQQQPVDDLHQSTGSSTSHPSKTDDDRSTPNTIEESVKDLIERADTYLSTRAEEGSEAETTTSSRSSSRSRGSSISSTRKREIEEEERIKAIERKKAIVDNYGKVEVDQASILQSEKPSHNNKAKASDPDEIDQERLDLLDQELKLLDMKKRQRKKVESKKYTNPDEILLRPNLNTKIVEHEEKIKKQELSMKSRMKIEKDKADLNKQKENQLKKKMEARAKAKKLERRA